VTAMNGDTGVLSLFHPVVARWFQERIGQPTEVQTQSWRKISSGGHVLITAPTGSGKTLAAFLWAIDQLVTGRIAPGFTSVLYVSPLRALNNDIQRNLLRPLAELRGQFHHEGMEFPRISVETRSGDTPQSQRARLLRHPPEILITTPESLNLMLSSVGGRTVLKNISAVILDEVHAVLGTKRGVYLMTAVERLAALSGEFQRISLSATVRSPDVAARFIGGYSLDGDPRHPVLTPRRVSVVHTGMARLYDIRVRYPAVQVRLGEDMVWGPLVAEFKEIAKRNRSTLLFANSRRLCEKLALAMNEGEEAPLAYVHHGSLSRETRAEVERKLRDGELKAVVATNSLELGIDIGALDEVILVQPPSSISSAIQRVGRAGHRVGEVCRGTIYPVNPHDLLEAAVLAPVIATQDLEDIQPVNSPLDVLAQVVVSMVGVETWDIDSLYDQVTSCYSYRGLSREQFDLVLNMLAGRYADSQIRDLRPQVSIDRIDNTIVARKGALLTLYTSGGVIPDRGYFHLRHKETNALIGELDEEFVWEAREGQIFSMGAQNWRIERITHNDVFVLPGSSAVMAAPFWKGEENYRDFHFSDLVGRFLEKAGGRLTDPDFVEALRRENHMEKAAAEGLLAFLKSQRDSTGADLPHRHHILVENVNSGPSGAPGNQLVLHTVWGNRVNRPFAMALDAAWEERTGQRLEMYSSNDCVVFQLPDGMRGEDALSMVSSASVESLLRKRLESSGFFGARFRECAGRALLLPKSRARERMPLWMNRLRSQKLLSAIMRYEDFPILLETWRTCLVDEFDLASLKQVLTEVESGVITWSSTCTNRPSPMAQHIVWRQTNEYMYMTDEPPATATSRLRDDLIRHVVLTPELRPAVSAALVTRFEEKLQRLAPGYSPEGPRDVVDWVKERILIPQSEWDSLLRAIERDHGGTAALLEAVAPRLVRIQPPGATAPLVAAVEDLNRISSSFFGDCRVAVLPLLPGTQRPTGTPTETPLPERDRDEIENTLLGEWLRFYGPADPAWVSSALGMDRNSLALALEDLTDSQDIIAGSLVTGALDEQICDSENFEILLRLARREAVPSFEAREVQSLPLFLAGYQGIGAAGGDTEALFRCLEHLRCLPLAAELWECEVLPARLHAYSESWLDSIMQEGNLRWVGGEKRTAAFCFEEDIRLLRGEDGIQGETNAAVRAASSIFHDALGRYDFSTLMRATGLGPADLSDRLWEAVWRGEVTNDSYAALRKGIMTRFEAPRMTASPSRRHGAGGIGFSRWKGSLPFAGNWFLLPQAQAVEDLLDAEELLKERVRVLLDRFGILFRELLERESVLFRWPHVFRALRLMELSGELLSGYFFKGIPGLQFMSPRAFQVLQGKLPENKVYWINATDPASLCGVQMETQKGELPRRIAGNHLVYHGTRLVLVSQKNGGSLDFLVAPDDPHLTEYFGVLRHMLGRQFQPLRRIVVGTINDEPASDSPYLASLRTSFEVMMQNDTVALYRRMGTAPQ
jgi:ATP-dependent helicase Lhr and Lhr-like helicase